MDENPGRSFPPRSAESRLVRAVSDAVKQTYTNPERLDCPCSDAIQAVVIRQFSYPNFDDTVDHIAMCAPCLEDYNRRRQTYRLQRRSRWTAGFAALLIFGLVWTYFSREHRPKNELAHKTAVPIVAATLDYSNWSAERSASPSPTERETPTMARARLALTLVLPIGTEDGPYTVRIRSASGEIVAQANGIAAWTGVAEKLNVNLDLRLLHAGAYTIAIQSADASQRAYPVLLE